MDQGSDEDSGWEVGKKRATVSVDSRKDKGTDRQTKPDKKDKEPKRQESENKEGPESKSQSDASQKKKTVGRDEKGGSLLPTATVSEETGKLPGETVGECTKPHDLSGTPVTEDRKDKDGSLPMATSSESDAVATSEDSEVDTGEKLPKRQKLDTENRRETLGKSRAEMEVSSDATTTEQSSFGGFQQAFLQFAATASFEAPPTESESSTDGGLTPVNQRLTKAATVGKTRQGLFTEEGDAQVEGDGEKSTGNSVDAESCAGTGDGSKNDREIEGENTEMNENSKNGETSRRLASKICDKNEVVCDSKEMKEQITEAGEKMKDGEKSKVALEPACENIEENVQGGSKSRKGDKKKEKISEKSGSRKIETSSESNSVINTEKDGKKKLEKNDTLGKEAGNLNRRGSQSSDKQELELESGRNLKKKKEIASVQKINKSNDQTKTKTKVHESTEAEKKTDSNSTNKQLQDSSKERLSGHAKNAESAKSERQPNTTAGAVAKDAELSKSKSTEKSRDKVETQPAEIPKRRDSLSNLKDGKSEGKPKLSGETRMKRRRSRELRMLEIEQANMSTEEEEEPVAVPSERQRRSSRRLAQLIREHVKTVKHMMEQKGVVSKLMCKV